MIGKTLYIAVVIIGVYLIINLGTTIYRLWGRQDEVEVALVQLENLKKENKDLKVQFEYSQTPEFLEKEARERLGLVKKGEKEIIIDPSLFISTDEAKPKESGGWWENWEKWLKVFF